MRKLTRMMTNRYIKQNHLNKDLKDELLGNEKVFKCFVFCRDDYPFNYVIKLKCEVQNRVIEFVSEKIILSEK